MVRKSGQEEGGCRVGRGLRREGGGEGGREMVWGWVVGEDRRTG